MYQLNFPSVFPQIETERLVLTSYSKKDLANFFALRSNPEFVKYLGQYPMQTTAEAEQFIDKVIRAFEKEEGITWKIALKGSEELIGYMGFWRIDYTHFRGEIGFGLHEKYQGRGFMLEAIHPILDYGFNSLNLHGVEANVDQHNISSIKLLEKVNFKKEAHFKENYYFDGEFIDSVIYCLLRKNFSHSS